MRDGMRRAGWDEACGMGRHWVSGGEVLKRDWDGVERCRVGQGGGKDGQGGGWMSWGVGIRVDERIVATCSLSLAAWICDISVGVNCSTDASTGRNAS